MLGRHEVPLSAQLSDRAVSLCFERKATVAMSIVTSFRSSLLTPSLKSPILYIIHHVSCRFYYSAMNVSPGFYSIKVSVQEYESTYSRLYSFPDASRCVEQQRRKFSVPESYKAAEDLGRGNQIFCLCSNCGSPEFFRYRSCLVFPM